MALRIVVAGEIYIDQVFSGFDSWPERGEESFAKSFLREAGGGAPHTAAGLARLGWDVVLAGPAGKETWLRGRLEELGLTYRLREHPTEPTGTTVSVSMPDDRTFFTYAGANTDFEAALADLPRSDHLHIAAPCRAAILRTLCETTKSVSVDAGWHPEWLHDPEIQAALVDVAWFFPNEAEAREATGESDPERMLRRFAELGVQAAVKLGAAGSAALQDGDLVRAPSVPITSLDTTGAGDCFNAGFLDTWLRGGSVESALRAGNVCGALSTRSAGGINGFPKREELNEWLSRSR